MSKTSNWPLGGASTRVVSPVVINKQLEQHPLTQGCYPLAVGRYEHASGHTMRRKRHDDNLLIYCFEGSGSLTTEHWQGDVTAGEIILLPNGIGHHYAAAEHNPWSIYWCHFSGTRARDFIDNMDYDASLPVKHIGDAPLLKSQFKTLLAESAAGYNQRAMIYAANMIKQLLTLVAKLLSEQEGERKTFNLEKVQAYMLQHLDQAVSLDKLAEISNLSKFYFSKRYREATGFTPIQHLIRMKIKYARYLLETSNMPVQSIADRVGYDDSLYFSRVFNQHEGCSPREYRRRCENN